MSAGYQTQSAATEPFVAAANKVRGDARGNGRAVLANIYEEDINIAVWQRELSLTLLESVDRFVMNKPTFETAFTTTPGRAPDALREILADVGYSELSANIVALVQMFCDLFGLKRAGLRLAILDHAMCPRFHVDKVPCRLVTTYYGVATEWLPHAAVERIHLGVRNAGRDDAQTGLFRDPSEIRQLQPGDVALLKGESWEGNEYAGLVHRSPAVVSGANRLLLSLDFCD